MPISCKFVPAIFRYSVLCIGIALGLQAADALAEEVVSKADSVRKYGFLAKSSRDKKEYDEAVNYYRQYFNYETNPKRLLKAYYFYGDVLYKHKKDYPAAKGAFLEVVKIDSLHRNSNLRLYALYSGEDKADSAAFALERLLISKPQDTERRRILADLYRLNGQPHQAIKHYKVLIGSGKDAERVEELAYVAGLYEELGATDEVLAWRRRLAAVQGDGSKQATLENVIELQIQGGQLKEALDGLEELVRLDSLNRHAYYSRMVPLAEKLGDTPLKLRAWAGMARANPADLETVAALAEWYFNDGQAAKARQWLDRGLAHDAEAGKLQLLKGDLLIQGGDEEGALAAFEVAKADPRWERVAQQRIWQIRPPETEEEKLKRAFFGAGKEDSDSN